MPGLATPAGRDGSRRFEPRVMPEAPSMQRHRRLLLTGWLVAMPALFGLLSIAVGQDANWDLRNYHLYNPWALLHGRIGVDIAPAEVPSYFNPLLDVPYHVLSSRLPPRLLAFLVGAFQGLNLLALYRIGTLVLPATSRRTIAVVLAVFAGADNAFTSEIGNTMGDATTAVLMLAALALALRADGGRRAARALAWAGLVAGLGVGLKLTNAPYAVGLVVAACAAQRPWPDRARHVAILVAGLAVGVATTYGFWGATLWSHFGNPFYPQFNGIFHSPLAAATMVVDNRFVPSGWLEALAFPLVFTALPIRIYEIPLVNVLWPIAYALGFAHVLRAAFRRVRGRSIAPDEAARSQRFLLVFAAASYLAWMAVFSIGRYLVTLDLLLPLLVWLLLHRWFATRTARGLVAVVLVASLVPIAFNFRTWGSADFGPTAYRVEPPPIAELARTTILVLTAPIAWILPHFPPALTYVSFGGTFPESAALHERIAAVLAARGPVYALLPADEHEDGIGNRTRLNRLLATLRVRKGDFMCRYASTIFANSTYDEIVFDGPADAAYTTSCAFRREPAKRKALFRDARAIVRDLQGTGLTIDLERCTIHQAWIGAEPYAYRFCTVNRDGPLRLP